MGKIYRIPYKKYRSWVDPSSRGLVILFGSLAILYSLALNMSNYSYSAEGALGLLCTPLFVIFILGLFLDDHPSIITRLIVAICWIMTVVSILSTLAYAHHILIGAKPPDCYYGCQSARERFELVEMLRFKPIGLLFDLSPLFATITFFGFASRQHMKRTKQFKGPTYDA